MQNRKTSPISLQAALAFGFAVLGFLLVVFGTFGPMSAFWIQNEPPTVTSGVYLHNALFYILPLFLGLGGALFGSSAMREIEQSDGKRSGDGPAVFAIQIGLLTTVIASIDIFVLLSR